MYLLSVVTSRVLSWRHEFCAMTSYQISACNNYSCPGVTGRPTDGVHIVRSFGPLLCRPQFHRLIRWPELLMSVSSRGKSSLVYADTQCLQRRNYKLIMMGSSGTLGVLGSLFCNWLRPSFASAFWRISKRTSWQHFSASPNSGVDKGGWGAPAKHQVPGLRPWFCQYAMEFLGMQKLRVFRLYLQRQVRQHITDFELN